MAQYGEVRVDYITYTTGTSPSEANATVTVSSLVNNPNFSGDINVEGNGIIEGNLNVSGDSLFQSITVSGNSILNTLTVTGGSNLEDVEISGTLTVTGNTNLNTLTVTGNSNLENVEVSGNLTVTGDLTVEGDLNASGVTISGFTGLFASGTAAAPSISFVGDEDTGIYNSNSNAVSITNAGVEHFRLNSDGLLAVGCSDITVDPNTGARFRSDVTKNMAVERVSGAGPGDALLEIKGVSQATGESSQTFLTSGPYLTDIAEGRKTRFNIKVRNAESFNSPGTRFTILSSGYVGINNELPSGILHIQGPVSSDTSGIPTLYLDRPPNINDTSDIALNANAVIGGQNSLNFVLSEDNAPFRFYVSGDANVSGIAGATQVFNIDKDGPTSIVSGVNYQVITAQDIGNQPSQVPLNRDLGTMAYQDNNPYVTSLRFPNAAKPLIYEEGTFDEKVYFNAYERSDGTPVNVTFNLYSTNYVRIGNQVTCNVRAQVAVGGAPYVEIGDRIQWSISGPAGVPYLPEGFTNQNVFNNTWSVSRRSNTTDGWLAGIGVAGGVNAGVLFYNPVTITSTASGQDYPINGGSWIFNTTYLLSPLTT